MKRNMSNASAHSPHNKKLPREFYDQPAVELSKALLGKVLVRKLPDGEVLRGTIVETEAYPGGADHPSHGYGGKKTERNAALFMDPGTAYVYFTYGNYHCFNISSQDMLQNYRIFHYTRDLSEKEWYMFACAELGGGCLVRAVEPLEDYQTMRDFRVAKKRKVDSDDESKAKTKKPLQIYQLANGPGKLCLAFDIHRATCNKLDLCTSDLLWLEESENESFHLGSFKVEEGKRVGIASSPPEPRNQLWRFFISDNLAVSTAKPSQIIKTLQLAAAH